MPDKNPLYNTSGPRAVTKEDKDAMNAMMKAKLAYAYIHGNPAAKRMVAPTDNPYIFDDGRTGTHHMSSYGKYAIPNIQDVPPLEYTGPRIDEAIKFDREEDAKYFAENYKRISPALRNGGKLKYNFENGGKLPVRKEGESDSDYYARWTPEDYKLLEQQILEAELNYGTLNKRFLDEKNRANTVTQKALEIARELGYNDEQWSEEQVPAAKGLSYKYDVESGEGEFSPRMISIDNPQDWEAIGMDFVNDPTSFVNNLRQSHPDPRENYLYDWDKEEYILDEEGNKQPTYQRGMGCIGAVCGIYNTAGATQASDFPTGFGNNIVKAGDPIFKQMSNKFLDENNYAGMRAMGFIPTDNPNEGDVMRIAQVPGSPYSSHSMIVNKINQEIGGDGFINTFDWDARDNVIENPGGLSEGIKTSHAPYRAYKDRASYWTYVGNTPQYEKEAIAANEELKRLQAIQSSSIVPTKIDMSNIRVSPTKTKYTLKEGTPYIPRNRKERKEFEKIQAAQNSDYPYRYFFKKKNGGSLAPIIPTYYKSKGTPIYRDTTDAPPKVYDNGGGLNPDGTQQVNLPSTTVYGSQESKKLQGNLFQKLDQLKRATKKYYDDRGFGKLFLKQDSTSDISGLKQNIQAYKDLLEEEKGRYAKAEIALGDLQKYYPDTWGDKKLADVFSPQGYQSLLSLQKNDKISPGRFRTYYDNFASEYDPYMAKGKGPDAVYSAKGARQAWGKDWDDFTSMINKFAFAAPLLGGAAALAPAAGSFGSAISRGAGNFLRTPFAQATKQVLKQPLLTNTLQGTRLAPYSKYMLSPLQALDVAGAVYGVDQFTDSDSTTRKSIRDYQQGKTSFGDAAFNVGMSTLSVLPVGAEMLRQGYQGAAGAYNAVKNVPQVRDFKAGLSNVLQGEAKFSDLFKTDKLSSFSQEGMEDLLKARSASLDPTDFAWFNRADAPDLHKYKVTSPYVRDVIVTRARSNPYNAQRIWQKSQNPLNNLTKKDRIVAERSIANLEDPLMLQYSSKIKDPKLKDDFLDMVLKPESYWKDPRFKSNPKLRKSISKAPSNKYEFNLDDDLLNAVTYDAKKWTPDYSLLNEFSGAYGYGARQALNQSKKFFDYLGKYSSKLSKGQKASEYSTSDFNTQE